MASEKFKQTLAAQAKALHAAALAAKKQQPKRKDLRSFAGAQRRHPSQVLENDMCNVCGQTPCNCTHIDMVETNSSVPGISGDRMTAVKLAIRRAQKPSAQAAETKYGVNYRKNEAESVKEARAPSGLTWTGSELKKRPELVAAANRRKSYQAYLRRKAAKEQPQKTNEEVEQIDEISQKLKDKYVERAVTAHGGYNMARRNTTGGVQKDFARKEKNTQKGISRALSTNAERGIKEAREADYGPAYQSLVLRVKQKAKEQEAKKPVDIQSLAKRLAAVPNNDKGSSK